MFSNLEELKWEQTGNVVVLKKLLNNGDELAFQMNEKFINHLVSSVPKLFFITIELKNENTESTYLLDFEKLKTIASTQSTLKIKIGQNTNSSSVISSNAVGRYIIARSESFYERYISEQGWKNVKKYFDIVPFAARNESPGTIQPAVSVPDTSVISTPVAEVKKTVAGGKLKECIKCFEIIPSQLDVCPYCNAVQNEPLMTKDSGDIDLSI